MSSENQIEANSVHTEECYEEIASQEQLYLDNIEENLREILISEEESARLLDGDGDDPPLSDETIRKMMRWLGAI